MGAVKIQEEKTMEKNEIITIDNSAKDLFEVLPSGEGNVVRYSSTGETSKLFNAVNGTAEKVADLLGETVTVSDIIVTSADVPSDPNDEDSEKENRPCVHFFTIDGRHISSISNGVCRSARLLISCGLNPTIESPVQIVFKEGKAKKGTFHTFDLV